MRVYKSDPRSKKHKKVDETKIMAAVEAHKKGMTLRKAQEKFGVSKSAIQRYTKKMRDGPIQLKKKGGQITLTPEFELKLVDCLLKCSEWGYALSSFDLRCFVKYHLDREGKTVPKFAQNFPGYEWALSFLERHKTALSQRLCQNIKKSRAQVSPSTINSYFDELANSIDGIPPHLIVNYDETALSDDPGRKKLIFKRGCKYPERVLNQTKSSVSVMFAATASGQILPSYVVYKSEYMYDLWTMGGPPNTFYNRSKSGWMDGQCFLDWVQKVVIPYFRRFEGKKLLIGDNLSSHLSIEVVRLCEEHNILFVFLPPNSTHLTQPLDISLFRPMKTSWRSVLEKVKMKNKGSNRPFDKRYFPSLLKMTLSLMEKDLASNIKAGFKKGGIVPLDRNQVLARLPSEPLDNVTEGDASNLNNSLTEFLKSMRYGNDSDLEKKQRGRKRRMKVPSGQAVRAADMQSEDDENEENLDDPEEMHDDLQEELELPNQSVASLEEGDWVNVKFVYNTGVKFYVGKILEVMNNHVAFCGSFLRQSSKSPDIFVFPEVPDLCNFKKEDIVKVLNKPTIKRGRHVFQPHPFQ